MKRCRNSLADKLLAVKLNKIAEHHRALLLQDNDGSLGRADSWQDSPGEEFPISGPERASAAFACSSSQGAVAVGQQLAEALLMLGHPFLEAEWLRQIVHDQCFGRESLDQEDFVLVVEAYERKLLERLEVAFDDCTNGGSSVSSSELPAMLAKAGVPLTLAAAEELLAESPPEQDFAALRRAYEDLVSRAGLSHAEHQRVRERFEELEDIEGTISEDEVCGILTWHESLLGLVGGAEIPGKLAREAAQRFQRGEVSLDSAFLRKAAGKAKAVAPWRSEQGPSTDGTQDIGGEAPRDGRANGSAVLAAVRTLHERTEEGLRTTLQKLNLNPDGPVQTTSVLTLLEDLGFIGAVPADVEAFLRTCHLEGKSELSFRELHTMVFRFCHEDGVTEAEHKDINAVFAQCDEDGSGTLEAGEIGPVIRWLGYQPTQYRVYDFAEEMGLSAKSSINLREFKRLAAKYKRMSLQAVRKAFLASPGNQIQLDELERLLRVAGYEPSRHEVQALVRQGGGEAATLDFCGFKQLELSHRRRVQQSMERNGGFTDGEYERHRESFQMGDPNGTGNISQKVLREMLARLFPTSSKDRDRHQRIANFVREADLDGNGIFDFQEFLGLMKKITEEMDRDILVKGLELKDQLGYSSAEVKQFRDLYQLCDEDMSGDIDFDELVSIFSNLVPMRPDNVHELRHLFNQVDDGDGHLDFWEFLSFMHRVQMMNLCGINDITKR